MLVEFYKFDIFNKFDPTKHPSKLREKKFEQYIYSWTRKVLSDMYQEAKNENVRTVYVSSVNSFSPSSDTLKNMMDNLSTTWKDVSNEIKEKKKKDPNKRKRAQKYYPGIRDFNVYIGVQEETSHATESSNVIDKLKDLTRSPIEEQIVELIMSGYNFREIAKILKCSPQNISAKFLKYKQRCVKSLSPEEVY